MNRKNKPTWLQNVLMFIRQNKVSLAFSVGLGCFISFFLTSWIKVNFLSPENLIKFKEIILSSNATNISFSFFDVVLLLIGVVGILSAPLMNKKNTRNSIMILLIIVFLFLDIILLAKTVVQQRVDSFSVFCFTLSCIYFVWLLGVISKVVYTWVKPEKDKIDVVKLTFVWTVIIAIFTLLK